MKFFTFLFILFFLFELPTLKSQVEWSGILYNTSDSNALSYTTVYVLELDKLLFTNEYGIFKIEIPHTIQEVHLEISAIGCHPKFLHKISFSITDTIKFDCDAIFLPEFTILYQSPESIMKQVVQLIKENYPDSSYIAFANYRQYQKINAIYRNQTEAQSAVLFRIETKNKTLNANEAIALNEVRKSKTFNAIEDSNGDKYKNLLLQNPIYHLQSSSFNSSNFNQFQFNFDTTAPENLYIIQYIRSGYSSENHGIDHYAQASLNGESVERGEITIDKETLAVIKFERRTERNRNYHYPKHNNFVKPNLDYTMEFENGYLQIEYKNIDGKYYLSKMNYCYTNIFFKSQVYEKEYEITDYFNWQLDSITHYLSSDLLQKFTDYTSINISNLPFHVDAWSNFNLPYFFSVDEN